MTAEALERGRSAFAGDDWRAAYELLSAAGRTADLAGPDLVRLGVAAFLVGEDADSQQALERAYHALLHEGEIGAAVRSAFWLGTALQDRGEHARASGWLARAARLVEDRPQLPERGYVLVPQALQALFGGDPERAYALCTEIGTIAGTAGDADLSALARLGTGQALISLRRAAEGLALLDEVMVAVQAGEVSPVPAGIVYCGVIEACRRLFDVRRAQEWTAALTRWCSEHPDLVPYRGQCLIHRSQILLFHGDWGQAKDAADEACQRFMQTPGHAAIGAAHYQRGEVLRLTGELAEAEDAYREATRWGHPPQPGLALLRVAQGRVDAARAAVERSLHEVADPVDRATLLAAQAEVALAGDEVATARAAADELAQVAASLDAGPLHATAAHVAGAVLLVEGDHLGALQSLRAAAAAWRELDAPYESARARVLIAMACRELGDEDGADMELGAATAMFAELGALVEMARIEQLRHATADASGTHGLSPREVEVLRLLATGLTNRAIAAELVISEHTVARHVQNIFAKIGATSRTSAAAFAFAHDLL